MGEASYVTLMGEPEPWCMLCDDPDCQEWPDARNDDGQYAHHVSECQVSDTPESSLYYAAGITDHVACASGDHSWLPERYDEHPERWASQGDPGLHTGTPHTLICPFCRKMCSERTGWS